MADPTPDEVLATPMEAGNAAGAGSVGQYLVALARAVWTEGSDFSGKRPFGDSDWQWDVYIALGRAGYVSAKFDREGGLVEIDDDHGDRLISAALRRLFELLPPPRLP